MRVSSHCANKAMATMSEFAASATDTTTDAESHKTSDSNEPTPLAELKTDIDLFQMDSSLSEEELKDLAMLDPALLTEKEIAETAQNQFDHAVQFLRHDLMRISGDADEADRFLRDNHTSEPLADAYAARLIAAERWQDLLNFADLVQRDKPNQCTVMFPEEVVPYEWETIREAAYEALGRRDELIAMYQERLDDTYDPNTALNHMKLEAWKNTPGRNQ